MLGKDVYASDSLLDQAIDRTRSHIADVGSGKFVGNRIGSKDAFSARYLAEEAGVLTTLLVMRGRRDANR